MPTPDYTPAQTAIAQTIDRLNAEVARLERLSDTIREPVATNRIGAALRDLNQGVRWLTAAYDALPETARQQRKGVGA